MLNIWNVPEDFATTGTVEPPLQLAYLPKSDQGDLTSLDWNPDGTLLAAGSYDAILRVCDASGKLYYSYEQHKVNIFPLFDSFTLGLNSCGGEGSNICYTILKVWEAAAYCQPGWFSMCVGYSKQATSQAIQLS